MAGGTNYRIGITADTTKAKQAINELLNELNKISEKPAITSNLQSASSAALELSRNLKSAVNQDTGKIDLRVLNDNFKKSGQSLQSYKTQLEKFGRTGQEAFMHVAEAIVSADVPLRNSNKMLSELWTTMQKTARWQLSTTVLNTFVGSIQTAYGYARDLDESLNRIQIVTKNSTEQMAAFANQANKAAQALSTTTTEYTNAALIYYQQGLSDQEVKERTNVTIDYANVSGITAEKASEQLTSIWNNFDDGTKSLEYYVDVMTKLGAATASSAKEISDGVQKFSAVASTIGLSYEYAASSLATITANTRESASVVGTALKTLFSRIQSLKLGETLDDGTDLNKYSEALYKVGINIKDTNGEIKDMDVLIDELGGKWKTLGRDQQLALAQTVAGVRQYNQLIALMDNFDDFQDNLSMAYGSTGELQAQADIYAQSWEAARDRVRAAAENIYDSLINPDFYIGIDNVITPLLSGIGTVIDAMGGMKGVLAALAVLMNKVYGDNIAQSLRNMATSIGFVTQQEQSRAKALKQEAMELMKQESYFQGTNQEQSYNAKLKEAQLYQDISSKMERMDSQSRELLQVDLDRVKALKEQIIAQSKLAEQSTENADTYENNILDKVTNRKLKRKEDEELKKRVNDQGSKLSDNIKADLNNINRSDEDSFAKTVNYMITKVKELSTETAKLKSLQGSYDGITPKIVETAQEMKLLNKEATDEEIKNFFDGLGGKIKDTSESTSALVELLAKLTGSGANAQRLASFIQQAEAASQSAGGYSDELSSIIEQITQKMADNAYITEDWATKLTKIGTVAAEAVMDIEAVQSLAGVFSDEDMTAGERIVTIYTSLSTLVPSVATAYGFLTKSKNADSAATIVSNALQQGENVTLQDGIVAHISYKIAKILKTKATVADTVATEADTAAHIANRAVLLGGIGVFAAVAAAIAGVTFVVYKLVKAYNAEADAAKEAAEQSEKLSEAYQKSKGTYDSLKQSIASYESAREGLDQLKEGTDEFKESLEKANEAALELINTNSQLAQYAYRDSETGEIKFRTGALENYQESQRKAMLNAQAAASFSQANTNEANIINGFTNLQRDLVAKVGGELTGFDINNDSQFESLIQAIYKAGGVINERTLSQFEGMTTTVKEAIVDMAPDFQEYIRKSEEAISSNKFFVKDGIGAILQTNDKIANLEPTFQSAIVAMVQNSETFKTTLNKEQNNQDMDSVRKEFAESRGYSTSNIKVNMRSGTADYYDEETNEVIAEGISDDIAKKVVAQSKAAASSIEGELGDAYINTLNKLFSINDVFNIDGLEDELSGFVHKVDTDFQNISQLTLAQVNFLHDELGNVINDMGDLDWTSLGYSSAEDFVGTFLTTLDEQWDLSTFVNNYVASLQAAGEQASSALQTIGQGEFLSDEQISALQQKFKGIFDLGNLEDLPLYTQAQELTEALRATFDTDIIEKNLKDQAEAAQKYYKDIKKEAEKTFQDMKESASEEFGEMGKSYEKIVDNWQKIGKSSKEIELDLQISPIESKIEKVEKKIKDLGQIKIDPIEIDVQMEDAWIDAVLGQLGAVQAASEFIGEGFTVSAENVEKLASIMPQIFEDAQVLSDGVVQLNQQIVDEYAQSAESIKDIHGQTLEEVLQQRMDRAQEELDIVNAVKDAVVASDDATIAEIMANTQLEKEDKEQAARLIIKAKIDEALQRQIQDNATTANNMSNSSQYANASQGDAQAVATNWTNSAQKIADVMVQAFTIAYNASQAMRKNQQPAGGSVGDSGIETVESTQEYQAPTVGAQEADSFSVVSAWSKNILDIDKTVKEVQENTDPNSRRFVTRETVAQMVVDEYAKLGLGEITVDEVLGNNWSENISSAFDGSTDKFGDSVNQASNNAAEKVAGTIEDAVKLQRGKNALNNAGSGGGGGGGGGKDNETYERMEMPEKDTDRLYFEADRRIKREQNYRSSIKGNFEASFPYLPYKATDLATAKDRREARSRSIELRANSIAREKEANEQNRDKAGAEAFYAESDVKDAIKQIEDILGIDIPTIETNGADEIINYQQIIDELDKYIREAIKKYNANPSQQTKAVVEQAQNFKEILIDLFGNYFDARDKGIEAEQNITELEQENIDLLKEADELSRAATKEQIQSLISIEDRYKGINRQLQVQQSLLEDIENISDRAYGTDRLEANSKKIENLNGQIEDYHKKISDERVNAQVDLENLRKTLIPGYAELSEEIDKIEADPDTYLSSISQYEDYVGKKKQLGNLAGMVQISNTGEILNLDEIYAAINKPVEDAQKEYNDFLENEWNAAEDQGTQAELQDKKEELESKVANAETTRDQNIAVIDQYTQDIDNIQADSDAIEDALRQIADAELDNIIYKLEVVIQVNDMKKAVTDLSKTISESFGDAITHSLESAEFATENVESEMGLLTSYMEEYNQLKEYIDNPSIYKDTAGAIDQLEELQNKLIESSEYLLEWIEMVENMLPEAIDAAAERFALFTNQLDHNESILDTIKELMSLQGATYKTMQGYNQLQRVSREKLETQTATAELQRKWYERAREELLEAEYSLQYVSETDVAYDTLKNNRDALLAQFNEAQAAYLESAQEAMETAKDMYMTSLEKASYDFSNAVSKGQGLDLLQDKFDHYIESEEMYLDKVNELYEVNSWNLKLQGAIDDAATQSQKNKLKALQDEINTRRKGQTLSEYDLKILEAKYDMITASNALEDARNAKNSLRLARDKQGNWNYQYTADDNEVDKAEQDFLEKQNEYYNIAKDEVKEVTSEILATWQECNDKIKELYEDQTLTVDEREARIAEVRSRYSEKVKELENEKQVAIQDMNQVGLESILYMTITGESSIVDMAGNSIPVIQNFSGTTKDVLDEMSKNGTQTISDFSKSIVELLTNAEVSSSTILNGITLDAQGNITGLSRSLTNTLESMGVNTVDILNGEAVDLADIFQEQIYEKNYGITKDMANSIVNKLGEMANGGSTKVEGLSSNVQSFIDDMVTESGEYTDIWENDFAQTMENMTGEARNFDEILDRYLDSMSSNWNGYQDTISKVSEVSGTKMYELEEQVDKVKESTDKCREAGVECAQNLWDQLDKIHYVSQAYAELAEKVMATVNAMNELAKKDQETVENYQGGLTYDEGTDYSALMASYVRSGGAIGDPIYQELSRQRNAKINEYIIPNKLSFATYGKQYYGEEFDKWLATVVKNPDSAAHQEWYVPTTGVYGTGIQLKDLIERLTGLTVSFDTGGYTGDFQDQRLAFLHEKELILNREDTQNILSAVQAIRPIASGDIFARIEKILDGNIQSGIGMLSNRLSVNSNIPQWGELEQNVHIEAVFPNAVNSSEIEDAFANLVNDAAQWVHRRKE